MPEAPPETLVHISKLEAATRQLNCAIQMWFHEEDQVAIHTLVVAAYQVIHDINAHRKTGHDGLFDSPTIRPEKRKVWNRLVREAGNFFKHADKDPDPEGTVEFAPFANEMYMTFASMGLSALGGKMGNYERALNMWHMVHSQDLLQPEALELLKKTVAVDEIESLRRLPKKEFFETALRVTIGRQASLSTS